MLGGGELCDGLPRGQVESNCGPLFTRPPCDVAIDCRAVTWVCEMCALQTQARVMLWRFRERCLRPAYRASGSRNRSNLVQATPIATVCKSSESWRPQRRAASPCYYRAQGPTLYPSWHTAAAAKSLHQSFAPCATPGRNTPGRSLRSVFIWGDDHMRNVNWPVWIAFALCLTFIVSVWVNSCRASHASSTAIISVK